MFACNKKVEREKVSILRPLGHGPNALPYCAIPLIPDAICAPNYKKVIKMILNLILALTMTLNAIHVIFFSIGHVKCFQNIL